MPILGICGGYQMLGSLIDDPERIEASSGGAPALGLLPHRTVFQRAKQTNRVRARVTSSVGPFAAARGVEIEGYEIHAGRSSVAPIGASAPLRIIARGSSAADEPEGVVSDDGLLFGTYLHGLFDNPVIQQSLVAWLQARMPSDRGQGQQLRDASLPTLASISNDFHVPTSDPYDRWADTLEASLDLPLLLERCGLMHPRRGN
jgi:adenosylcobyric acid synthase